MEHITQPDKQELLCLILADMRNRKLILGLEAAGLSSEDFYTDLANLILAKTGFPNPQDEELYSWYEQMLEHLIGKDLSYFKVHHHALADTMYGMLMIKKQVGFLDGV